MKTAKKQSSKKQNLHTCGCCKRALPTENFYVNRKTNTPDNYCKECRKSQSRNRRNGEKQAIAHDKRADYPVITRTKDPVLRRELIRKALEKVAASIERKKQKIHQAEYDAAE